MTTQYSHLVIMLEKRLQNVWFILEMNPKGHVLQVAEGNKWK